MSRPNPLSKTELNAALVRLPGWTVEDGKLTRELQFKDFNVAFAFMTAVALKAEKIDHHPEWFNVYNRVKIRLITHDTSAGAGPAITQADVDLALFCDERSS